MNKNTVKYDYEYDLTRKYKFDFEPIFIWPLIGRSQTDPLSKKRSYMTLEALGTRYIWLFIKFRTVLFFIGPNKVFFSKKFVSQQTNTYISNCENDKLFNKEKNLNKIMKILQKFKLLFSRMSSVFLIFVLCFWSHILIFISVVWYLTCPLFRRAAKVNIQGFDFVFNLNKREKYLNCT